MSLIIALERQRQISASSRSAWSTRRVPEHSELHKETVSGVFWCFPVYTLCEGVKSPETGVTDSCELPYGCWELNSGPLEEQPVLLIIELFLQPLRENFLSCIATGKVPMPCKQP